MALTNFVPRVGVGAIVLKQDQVLLGQRLSEHGKGSWSFPGGHLEFGESLEACASRELFEETGLTITRFRLGPYTNSVFTTENKHYLTVFMLGDWRKGEPVVMEPEKCRLWKWFDWNDLPQPLFLPIKDLIEVGYSPFAK